MADEEEVVEAEEVPEVVEAKEAEKVQEPEKNFDEDARKQGWVDKDEFYGDPDDWRDSKEFISRGKEILSHVKSTYDKRISTMEDASQKQQQDFAQRIERMERMNNAALTTQAEQIRTEYSAKKLAAVRDMDEEAHIAAEVDERKALDGMRRQVAEANKPSEQPAGPKISKVDQETISEWMTGNQWFFNDRVLNAAGDEHFMNVNSEMPGASMTERLEETKRRVAEDFPKKFGARPNGQPRVEGGGRQAGGGSPRTKFAGLPQEAKSAFTEMKSRGIYTDKDKEEYATAYNEE